MLALKPRIDFGGQPWPSVVPEFSLSWLKSTLVPAQLARHNRILAAIKAGEAKIEAVRKDATNRLPVIGEKRPNGLVFVTAEERVLQAQIRSHAERQTALEVAQLRNSVDKACNADLLDMDRATATTKDLSERVFSKIACLSRVVADLSNKDVINFKSGYASFIRGISAIELFRLAQEAIDEGSPLSLVKLDCIRIENFARSKDNRAFSNQVLLDLISVPEFNTASGLLNEIVDLRNAAGGEWAGFMGNIGQASLMRIQRGLANRSLTVNSVPILNA